MPAVKPEAGVSWTCDECRDEGKEVFVFEQLAMLDHMTSVHEIDVKTEKGRKSMVMHMDGAGWHTTIYEWTFREGTIAEMKFHQTITGTK